MADNRNNRNNNNGGRQPAAVDKKLVSFATKTAQTALKRGDGPGLAACKAWDGIRLDERYDESDRLTGTAIRRALINLFRS